MLHELKLNKKYCEAVYWGYKNFEIRLYDRNYKVGDFVRFIAVDSDGSPIEHKVNRCYYQIDYILTDFDGLAKNYIAFNIRKHNCFFHFCKPFNERGVEACFGCNLSDIERQQGN